MSGILSLQKPGRTIDALRKRFPGKWTWNSHGQFWEKENGDIVRRVWEFDAFENPVFISFYYYPKSGKASFRVGL